MKKILLMFVLIISFSACEKDDICTDETTPRLIVEFYDISNNATIKNVLNLKVKEFGTNDFMVFDPTLEEDDEDRYLFNGSKLELPLKLAATSTKYSLILNSTGTTPNEDVLEFVYTPENVYVSRACGYKTIFELNPTPNGVIKSDVTTPESFWIQDFNILTTTIDTENETHIKVYF